ncbi:MAG: NAD(P)/FAD-dependent oxidoreductase [Pelagimonas sp.]|jgi:phytoene dehydrogenase-like protein|nr:NAD(P)/FAD-dependent oxidoreductase [Pelagimonas sp.]
MLKAFDAIVAGAGLNSLACAMMLQRKGWSVAIYEQADHPGGAVKTGEYTLPGYRHDWAAMNLSLFAGSGFFREFSQDLTAAGLEFAPAGRCFASAFADGKWLGVDNDSAANLARISAFANNDADAWSALTDSFPGEAEHIFAILGASFGKRDLARTLWRLMRKKGVSGTLDLGQFLAKSPRAWLDEIFESDHVKSTLAAWGMHLDFAPDVAGGALFPYLEAMANQAFGMVIGKGGADTITRAMIKCIEAKGGQAICGQRIDKVETSGGRATGVVLASGDVVRAKRAVIANVAPRALAQMAEGLETPYKQALNSFRHAPGTMMMHLAMEDLPDWAASPELREYAYVHLAPSLDQMARTYLQAQAGLLPDEPVIVVGQPTAIDPSRAPEGKHILWMQVRMVPGDIKGDASGKITACDWPTAGPQMAERALDILNRHAPGVREKINAMRVVTPDELQADNPNLVGGDQICGSHHLSQHFLFRPMRGRSDGSTPIKGLYHTGAAVWPGAGTGAGSGYLLGQKLTS